MTNRNTGKEVLILKRSLLAVCTAICLLTLPGCGQAADTTFATEENPASTASAVPAQRTVPRPDIVDKPILWNGTREQLIREYTQKHYGKEQLEIVPQAVVVHWTGASTWEGTYSWFYKEAMANGTLNVASQFLVDRDGTIYQLTPATAFCRHAIGYNWCSIGIENVGGADDTENLTEAQLQANIQLIRYLHQQYPTIQYVFGHYQQVAAHASGLYHEDVPGYHSIKADPGPQFMRGLRENLSGDGLTFYPE